MLPRLRRGVREISRYATETSPNACGRVVCRVAKCLKGKGAKSQMVLGFVVFSIFCGRLRTVPRLLAASLSPGKRAELLETCEQPSVVCAVPCRELLCLSSSAGAGHSAVCVWHRFVQFIPQRSSWQQGRLEGTASAW